MDPNRFVRNRNKSRSSILDIFKASQIFDKLPITRPKTSKN
jgi:hypothetical protein